jgi:hypothetical protein
VFNINSLAGGPFSPLLPLIIFAFVPAWRVFNDLIPGGESDPDHSFRVLLWSTACSLCLAGVLSLYVPISRKRTRSPVTQARAFIDERIREKVSQGETDFSTVQESITAR